MFRRLCPNCGSELATVTSKGGLRRRVCKQCNQGDVR